MTVGFMKQATLRVGVLNDDTISMADDGYKFVNRHASGKFLVTYWTYANAWCNTKHQFVSKSLENAIKRYEKIRGKLSEEEKDSVINAMWCD